MSKQLSCMDILKFMESDRSTTHDIERHNELLLLNLDQMKAVQSGESQIKVITGPFGSGKTAVALLLLQKHIVEVSNPIKNTAQKLVYYIAYDEYSLIDVLTKKKLDKLARDRSAYKAFIENNVIITNRAKLAADERWNSEKLPTIAQMLEILIKTHILNESTESKCELFIMIDEINENDLTVSQSEEIKSILQHYKIKYTQDLALTLIVNPTRRETNRKTTAAEKKKSFRDVFKKEMKERFGNYEKIVKEELK